MKSILIEALLISLLSLPAAAGGLTGGNSGATPFNFLNLDANARPAALGGAYAALATDANALLYNPAGLGYLKSNEVTLMHNAYFQDASQEYGALVLNRGSHGFGLMVNTLGYGQIPRTTISNPSGQGLGAFGSRDWEISLGYGQSFHDHLFGFGVAAKYLREEIDDITAQAVAADVGLSMDFSKVEQIPLSLGLVVQNLGTDAKFQNDTEKAPVNFKAGAAYKFMKSGTFVLDINRPRYGSMTLHQGVEFVLMNTLALRAGYNGRIGAGPGLTAGAGITEKQFSVDYAFVPVGDLGSTHRLSVSWRWGAMPESGESGPLLIKIASSAPTAVTPEQHFAQAEKLIAANDFNAAKHELQEADALLNTGDRRKILYYERLGHIFFLEDDIPKARTTFSEGMRFATTLGTSDPGAADLYVGMGLCLVKEKHFAYAAKFFEKALEANPSPRTRQLISAELKQPQTH